MNVNTIIMVRQEKIRCPRCGMVQNALCNQVEGAEDFERWHVCDICKYMIEEDEWDVVEVVKV